MDRLKEVLDFVMSEIDIFKKMEEDPFNNGVVAGLSLVKGYLNSQIEWEGKKIAEAHNGDT